MNVRYYAHPDCKRCHGRGRIKTGQGITDWAVCPCVRVGQRLESADKLIKNLFPGRAQEMTFESFQTGGNQKNEQALQVAENFVDNWKRAREKGWVLGFYGEPRTGKTHLAVATAHACIMRFLIRPMLFNLPKALKQERERFNRPEIPSPFKEAQKADLLILDDLGAEYERQSDDPSRVSWLTEQIYTLLDERFMNNLPMIYTSNLSPSDMQRRYDNEAWQRVYSRLESAQVTKPLQIFKVEDVAIADPEARSLLYSNR